jgi:hypothetical protein
LEPEPLPPERVERLRLLLAGRAFFVELALVDFDLRDELGRAEVERFFV